MTTLMIGIAALVGLAVLAVMFVLSRFKVAGPNEAFVITGRKGRAPVVNPETGEETSDLSGQKVVMGASVFVVPFIQRLGVLDLNSQQINVSVGSAVSSNGIRCALEGVAIVKVGGTENAIRAAAQRFMGHQEQVSQFCTEVLSGSLRSIVGRLTVEDIIRDRAAFAREVSEEAEASLTPQGLVLDSFQLQDIQAEGNYLADLGRPEAARAEKDAKIAEAAARREAEEARLAADEAVAEATRTFDLRQAEIQAETDAARAAAEAAGPRAKAEQDREVLAAQQQVAEEEARLKERQLDTEIRRPADAQRYAAEQEAEARKTAEVLAAEASKVTTVAAAEADAEKDRLTGAGERQRREELAAAVRIEGESSAAAIRATGAAEAEAMEGKAAAYAKYGQAAISDQLIAQLPEIVRAGSEPLAAIDSMTVISTDGASKVSKAATTNIVELMEMAKALTGIDLTEVLSGLAGATPQTTVDATAAETTPASTPGA
jgi:flotillin